MIISLYIKNYALINELQVKLEKGFTVITGETGAGKSILLGALNLIAGQRADIGVLFNKQEKCIVEAEFDLNQLNLQSFFELNDLDYQTVSIVRREIGTNGKSRAFVNDTPVNLSLLKELSQHLIDIHSQHQSLEINAKESQLNTLDWIAKSNSILQDYTMHFNHYKKLQSELKEIRENELQQRNNFDYFTFQLNEIEELNLRENEYEELKSELSVLAHSEEIKTNLQKAAFLFSESENNLLQNLNEIKTAISGIARYNKQYEEMLNRLQSSVIEIKDISGEVETHLEKVNFDPKRLSFLNQRIADTERLMRKHGLTNSADLLKLKNELSSKIFDIDHISDKIKSIENELNNQEKELFKKAALISKQRKAKIPEFEKSIATILHLLGMPNAKFSVQHHHLEQFNSKGIDDIEFLFSANKGVAPAPMQKVASGGELSRIMLAIKSIIASVKTLPSIVFDEIDTGISGDVAAKMGNIMKEMAQNMQVISITHLPQIASKGNQHWYVYKENTGNSTTSYIKILNEKERLHEIAKMLSSEKMSDAAISNAKELLGYAKRNQ
ncbi:MAG: DNA repair protein RecN [Bacteroidia bacterium]|nr:DNA repair protein RecN [Bacteroidia bacterium]MCZ2247902.1 DNA repair protein RecN [Bacteroidia bacterium]